MRDPLVAMIPPHCCPWLLMKSTLESLKVMELPLATRTVLFAINTSLPYAELPIMVSSVLMKFTLLLELTTTDPLFLLIFMLIKFSGIP